ncbi:MAG TPA: hypothetical protein VMC83_23660 [Streptosporangiaceae bacterium]|nr:hypothetical protein [Streptosporangiaceae bacterium]
MPWLSPAFTPSERVGQGAGPATAGVVAGPVVAGVGLGEETGVAVGVLDGGDEEVLVEAEHAAARAAQQASSVPASTLLAVPRVDVMSAVSFSPVGSASRVIHRTPIGPARLARILRCFSGTPTLLRRAGLS